MLEIEHKFVVPDGFDLEGFFRRVRALSPTHEFASQVTDTYFFSKSSRQFVLRHRVDAHLQQLTVKSLSTHDASVRTEVNLELDQSKGNQSDLVAEFCNAMRIQERAQLKKSVQVFEFQDAEIVFYRATMGALNVQCIEFEALEKRDVQLGLSIIHSYESKLGFDQLARETRSLFDLLVLPQI